MKKYMRVFLLVLTAFGLLFSAPRAQSASRTALVMTAEGPIVPPMLEYFKRGIQTAERRGAEVLVVELNTPGGSVDTMLDMIQLMKSSRVPIVVYVAPREAIAGSAGALITMAGGASAMAPGTAIGAASPISSSGEDINKTLESKVKEILKAKARSLVERRGKEATRLAEAMIDSAKAVTADEALKAGLIDFIAADTRDLLNQLDGFEAQAGEETRVLRTAGIEIQPLGMSFIESFLLMLTDPNIAFLLLAIGVQAILIELSSPGGWVAGFIGAVCVTLAVYGMGVLPVNWFGVIFLFIAFVLFVLDIKAATHGALTAAGAASFIVGALVLFNSPGTPDFQRVSVPLVIGMGIFIGLIFFLVVFFALRAQHGRIQTGVESLAGKTGMARTTIKDSGQVQLESELWSAEKSPDSPPIRKGDAVEVVEVRGLRLIVRKR